MERFDLAAELLDPVFLDSSGDFLRSLPVFDLSKDVDHNIEENCDDRAGRDERSFADPFGTILLCHTSPSPLRQSMPAPMTQVPMSCWVRSKDQVMPRGSPYSCKTQPFGNRPSQIRSSPSDSRPWMSCSWSPQLFRLKGARSWAVDMDADMARIDASRIVYHPKWLAKEGMRIEPANDLETRELPKGLAKEAAHKRLISEA